MPSLDAAGNPEPGWEAHHIVPWGDRRSAKLRERLEELGIDLDSVANGVFLPNSTVPDGLGRTLHGQTMRREYFNYLDEEFKDVTTREDALERLEEIKQELLNGRDFPPASREAAFATRVEYSIGSTSADRYPSADENLVAFTP